MTDLKGVCALIVLALVAGASTLVGAEEIQLKDGTKVSGTVLQKDDESVYVQLPRASVESVDGKPLPPPVAAGTTAPAFEAVDLAGAPQSLAANKGHVVLLQFWASWCPHCRSDLPYLKELATKYPKKGLRVLTVSVDQELDKLQAFLQKEQVPYPVIHAAAYPSLPERYEMQGIPGYYLIDAKGTIAKVWAGALTEGPAAGKAELEGLLDTLLKTSETPTKS
ncbi:MAG: TlpA family protein disulfide reductase [Candidatus Omnitrophica bacterium]|nr:TlpA family protein disulfide reductase [Candidatus Omnitrophota bacterium]